MISNKNYRRIEKNNIVTIGRMKGNISIGDKIYKIEDVNLNKSISPTFLEDKNIKKIPLYGEVSILKNKPITFKVWSSNDGYYKSLEYTASTSEIFPEEAINKPLSRDSVIKQLSKTGSTEFEFKNINVILDDNVFISKISILNDLRRNAISGLENLVLEKNTHFLKQNTPISYPPTSYDENVNNNNIGIQNKEDKKCISLLLNILSNNIDYNNICGIDKLYIPAKYFFKEEFKNLLKTLCSSFQTYIYMPVIVKDTYRNLSFENIITEFNIKGFVVSNISQFDILSKFNNMELIGNYNLNIYNNFTIETLKKYNLTFITVSPELNLEETNDVLSKATITPEVIVYGKIPVMTNNYCYLGKSNKCYKTCSKNCINQNNKKYFLRDRMNFDFRIEVDNICTLTTIYNSKILSVMPNLFNTNNYRIDILDENINEIQNIIDAVNNNKRFEGKNYTNGYYIN